MIDAPAVGRMELERLLVLSMLQPNTVRTNDVGTEINARTVQTQIKLHFLFFRSSLIFLLSELCFKINLNSENKQDNYDLVNPSISQSSKFIPNY